MTAKCEAANCAASVLRMRPELHRLHRDLGQTHWWFVARRRILMSIVREALKARPCSRPLIVEVGCGVGDNVAELSKEFGGLGIDASQTAIELARERYPQETFIVGDSPESAGEAIREASLLLMADVLEHVEDDRAFLARWTGALSVGASILITVPADPSLWSRHDRAHGHYRRYELLSLQEVWRGLPVEVELLSYFNRRLFPIARLARRRRSASRNDIGPTSDEAGNEAGNESSGSADLRLPPFAVNAVLQAIFQGEAKRLIAAMHGKAPAYKSGLSLIALLRKRSAPAREPNSHDG